MRCKENCDGTVGESQLFRVDAVMSPHVESADSSTTRREPLSLRALFETLDQHIPEAERVFVYLLQDQRISFGSKGAVLSVLSSLN